MRLVLISAVCMALASPVAAQSVTTPDSGSEAAVLAMDDVITRQLNAFNARDVDAAWDLASPMIQSLFGMPRNFGVMVSQGYPMVWDNSAAKFISQRREGGTTYRKVIVQDANGALHTLEYAMIQTSLGWKIDGVSLLPAPDVGV